MVQAAKLIGAGSALIALAGVGAGIGIVFGSCALLSCGFDDTAEAVYCAFIVSSKALFPGVSGNGQARSGNESPVNNGGCCKTPGQARSGMDRLTNLNNTLSVKKNTASHTLLKGRLDHDSSTGNKKSLLKVGPGNSYQEISNVQSPNPVHLITHGTAGLPKGRKSYGNGAFIIGGLCKAQATKGRQASVHKKRCLNIPAKGCHRLQNLWKSNQQDLTHVNYKLIHLVRDMEVLIFAYEQLKYNSGNITPGRTKETLDDQTFKMLQHLSKELHAGKYKFSASERVFIVKPGKKTVGANPQGQTLPGGAKALPVRTKGPPGGISKNEKIIPDAPVKAKGGAKAPPVRPKGPTVAFKEKIVQKALSLVLEAIYEPVFSQRSHGFRPAKGTHTALRIVAQKFIAVSWVIEAHISKSFITKGVATPYPRVWHKKLLRILSKRIACEKTMALLKSALKAGYMDSGRFSSNKDVGISQGLGSIISPLLCNIYMNELDLFVERLQSQYNKGTRRRPNPIYRKLMRHEPSNSRCYKQLCTKNRSVHSTDWIDPGFIRVRYVRYADHFVIGIAGPRSLAVQIQEKVQNFVADELKLEMSKQKTLLTHFTHKYITFLGINILNRSLLKNKPVKLIRGKPKTTRMRLSFHAPIEKIQKKLVEKGFFKWNKDGTWLGATALRRLINLPHAHILRYYESIIHGIINYYSFVDNISHLLWVVHKLKYSCARTLRLKYKLRFISKVFIRFGPNLKHPTTGLELRVPATYKRTGLNKPTDAFTATSEKWSK
eukprot:GHRR01001070.1.p1 GENE.GHRR01001070.1~~GHRR01001070.1.p1  ORF type:complete len:801 (-),score=-105.59 GHRR01001070.1:1977-4301(-)